MIPCILAHDLGTSGNKASLFGTDGKLLDSAVVPYSPLYPKPGWAEEDPWQWWHAVSFGINTRILQFAMLFWILIGFALVTFLSSFCLNRVFARYRQDE